MGLEPVQARVRNLGNGTYATAGRGGRLRVFDKWVGWVRRHAMRAIMAHKIMASSAGRRS